MCKWLKDEVCVNSDCPAVADFCPVVNHPGVCRYEENELCQYTAGSTNKHTRVPVTGENGGNVMDAVKFIEERNRMCKSFGDRCTGCPASDACGCCAVDQAVDQASTLDATAQVAIVEKWSAAHPRKTRQSVFLEQYPDTIIDLYGVLGFCPTSISSAHRDSNGACKDPERLCRECRKEFWSQEVE